MHTFLTFIEAKQTPLQTLLWSHRTQLLKAAQAVYDVWEGEDDPEIGHGGICDQIATAMSDVISSIDPSIEVTNGGQDGDDHAFLIVCRDHEACAVDIPYWVYERGGGYSWTKIPNVTFTDHHLIIEPTEYPDLIDEDIPKRRLTSAERKEKERYIQGMELELDRFNAHYHGKGKKVIRIVADRMARAWSQKPHHRIPIKKIVVTQHPPTHPAKSGHIRPRPQKVIKPPIKKISKRVIPKP